ncbi:MAG: PBP1A family penicillin-binding protein [Patescibacteria group bacterium]|nr:PBP1A family penicillin-binding protein [Patescibacteria group bacterium]
MRKKRRRRILFSKQLWLLILTLGLLGFSVFLWWIITLDIPSFESFTERIVTESTKIYDRTGKILLYDVHEDIKRKVIPFEEISKHVKNATVAIEDNEFYEHKGIKPSAILRSVLVNLGAGSVKQGGSTITQQLVKNTLLTREKLLSRKIKEAVLAIKIEQVLSKEEILNLYLNEIPYGGSLYGIEEASQAFFRKPASELSLTEAAYLAAIPKAPTYYSPYGQHRDKLEERKNVVIMRMEELGFINAEEARTAREERATFSIPEDNSLKAPHFVMMIRNYLEQEYGREALLTQGLKVTTTIDWDLQRQAEEIINRYATENIEKFNANNAGLVAIDPKTGQIIAMVGSRDYFDSENEGNFNITLAHRQPGSSFKPFVYAAAFNKGYTPETVVFDLQTQFDTNCRHNPSSCYTPNNYDDTFRGPITLRSALAQSINVPAIKVLYLVGLREAIAQATAMGIASLGSPNLYGLTLVLGGGEVSLLDMVSSYSVFAAEGERHSYASILKIEDDKGTVLEEFENRSRSVLPTNSARLISSILSDNEARHPSYGTGSPLEFTDRPVAVKTGTTNDYRDAWIIGYTPNIVIGAWAGNNDNSPMERKVAGLIVAPMWRATMNAALKNLPIERFTAPETADPDSKPVFRGYWQGSENYFIDKISGKLATDYTPEETREERILQSVHSILHWVKRSDPLGSVPNNPANDSQYALWETPIRTWAAARGMSTEQGAENLPRDYDDVHTPSTKPSFEITSPDHETIYNANQSIAVQVNYSGRYPLAQIDAFLGDTYLGSAKSAPHTLIFTPQELDDWQTSNRLRVVAYDSVRNRAEQNTTLRLSGTPTQPTQPEE